MCVQEIRTEVHEGLIKTENAIGVVTQRRLALCEAVEVRHGLVVHGCSSYMSYMGIRKFGWKFAELLATEREKSMLNSLID